MNEFEKCEEIGRNKTKMLFPNYQFAESPDISEVWDFSGQTPTLNYFIEVKDRQISSTAFDSSILEADKLKNLTAIADANGKANMYYLCFYTDGVAYSYNLRNISITDINIVIKNAGRKTVIDVGKKDKIFIEIPHRLGRKYIYQVTK
ncbi:hypothetical protein LJ707_13225 [Mucilaginibacter sp. UR6-1]|uniref:hypothetical protein n=1 Tax=Mucilaginibacter sp. UR6-1 TaxID=1435643 RepID=UPI001E5B6302|nr:hypothetical protein [Mucilaginibacter sp. UR6-1]MCC8409893.1 hypothetical protein [Mucilaginibacter sp. UR6-1]